MHACEILEESMKEEIVLIAHIKCPACGSVQIETMPEDQCIQFWQCPVCNANWMPENNDCCVYCSYADVACPTVQRGV